MPTVPVRDLGSAGIVTDVAPFNLPPNAFSSGVNVRFSNGTVRKGPVPRLVFDLKAHDASFLPRHLFSVPASVSGADSLVTVSENYSKVYQLVGTTVTDITADAMTPSVDPTAPITHGFLGSVVYLNRRTSVPFMRRRSDTKFVPLPNWNSTWRCNILRPFKDFLIALDVTKGAVDYPQMVKWSDIVPFGSPPPSWDETLTTNSAGENVLNEMQGRIIDGHTLRDTFLLYGENEVWAMSYVGGAFIFDFRKRFDDMGVIAPNCVVEVDGQHFVFSRDDIIVHDGATKRSIAHGRVRNFIFNSLNRDIQHLCFVTHNPFLAEISFCYPSQDGLTGFAGATDGCNRAAVYNYRSDLWTFYDLPNVTAATNSVLVTGQSWASVGSTTWSAMGGTYMGEGSENERHHIFASREQATMGITASRLVGMDLINGSRLATPIVSELLKDAIVERVAIDLDESGAAIRDYKSLLKVYPQLSVTSGTGGVELQFGAHDVSAATPNWDNFQPFSPSTGYQLSIRRAGRYLAHRIRHTGNSDFSYSGFDATIQLRGKR